MKAKTSKRVGVVIFVLVMAMLPLRANRERPLLENWAGGKKNPGEQAGTAERANGLLGIWPIQEEIASMGIQTAIRFTREGDYFVGHVYLEMGADGWHRERGVKHGTRVLKVKPVGTDDLENLPEYIRGMPDMDRSIIFTGTGDQFYLSEAKKTRWNTIYLIASISADKTKLVYLNTLFPDEECRWRYGIRFQR